MAGASAQTLRYPPRIANWGLSPAKFRHVSSRLNDVKATVPRSEAPKVKKAKAELRPSSVVLDKDASKRAGPSSGKLQKPAASLAKPNGRGKHEATVPVAAATRPAAAKSSAGKVAPSPVKQSAAKPVAPAAPKAKASPLREAFAPSKPASNGSAGPSKPAVAPSAKSAGSKSAGSPKSATAKAGAPRQPAAEPASAAPAPKKVARKSIKEAAGVSTDAVARRTGKTWDDWFEVLDSAGAATLDQRGIVAILAQKHGIGPWWQQMIAVGYESLRGKSEKPVVADGFQISHSCTLSAPVARVFKLWNDASERARWLADDRFVVKSATPGKALRARWGKGTSQVAVSFSEKAGKTEVAVEHQQIESRAAADQMKAYWQKKLGLLDDALAARR